MKMLHLFSNWRWTGPAEPATTLAAALHRTDCDVIFACAREPRGRDNGVLQNARRWGLPTCNGLQLAKHMNPLRNLLDGRRLRRWLSKERFDIIHAHLRNAHVVAALGTWRMDHCPLIVRTCYSSDGPGGQRDRFLLRHFTDGLIVVSEFARQAVIDRLGFPPDRVWSFHTPIDINRFSPDRCLGDRRAEYGIDADAFVVGIIARIQRHRRYAVFLKAIDLARHKLPNLRVIVVGRGTNMKSLALDPIRRMRLTDVVVLPGYQSGNDFVRTIASMDIKVYLVPGTDGSCRAVREAMAMGVPVIGARRGILPELLGHDERGLIIDDSPENLADAILELALNRDLRLALAKCARKYAIDHFSLKHQSDVVGGIYRELAERGRR